MHDISHCVWLWKSSVSVFLFAKKIYIYILVVCPLMYSKPNILLHTLAPSYLERRQWKPKPRAFPKVQFSLFFSPSQLPLKPSKWWRAFKQTTDLRALWLLLKCWNASAKVIITSGRTCFRPGWTLPMAERGRERHLRIAHHGMAWQPSSEV